MSVRLGEHNTDTNKDCRHGADDDNASDCQDPVQDIIIEKAIRHPNYDRSKKVNDIALLRLMSAADVTKNNVKTICLPTSPENQIEQIDAKARNRMIITGWGLVPSGVPSNILLKATVPYVTNSDCIEAFSILPHVSIYPTYLCAGGLKNKTDTCKVSGDK